VDDVTGAACTDTTHLRWVSGGTGASTPDPRRTHTDPFWHLRRCLGRATSIYISPPIAPVLATSSLRSSLT